MTKTMTFGMPFTTNEETEKVVAEEKKRLEELMPGSRVTRSSTIRVLIAKADAKADAKAAQVEHTV